MTTTTVTSEQLAKLKTALENAVSGKAGVQSASYPAPKVEPVNSFGVLEPDINDAVNDTHIVIDPAPTATSVVSFYWNGDYTIPAETSDGSPMRVKVPPALVIAAANTTIAVIYAVVGPDDPQGVASSLLSLVVGKYTEPAYPKPVITEAQGGKLDVTQLKENANVTVQPWPGIAVDQMLWLNAVSSPPIELTKWQGFRITSTGVQSTVIGRTALQTLGHDEDLTLKLEVSFDGGVTKKPFPLATYKIINPKDLDLPAPVLKEASGGVLNPVNVLNGATATVAYADMLLTDSITLIWNGDKTSIGAASGNAAKSVDFNVPVNLIAAAMGKSIEVSYEVTRDGEVLPSRKLTLSIGTLSKADLGQSKPVITEANGTTLDLNTFTDDAHITVSKWPLAAVGQRVWLTVYGPTGAPLAQLLVGFPITDADGLNGIARALARALLQGLAAGATIKIKVEIKVTFDGSTNETDAIRFPESVYSVVQQVVQVQPTITSIVDAYGYGISNGGMTYASSGRISGTGAPSGSIDLYDGNAFIRSVPVNGNGQWSTEWGAYAAPTGHSFTARNPGGGLSSNAWTFRIEVTLVRDHTSFENDSFNGWQFGPAVSPYDSRFEGAVGQRYWHNLTTSNNSAGVVLKKTINNLKVGALYKLEMAAIKLNAAGATPLLSCHTSQGERSQQVSLPSSSWTGIACHFTPRSNSLTMMVSSHVSTFDGNDYGIHGIDVTYVSG